jgi:PelA/Pel-15E family pectate lyase
METLRSGSPRSSLVVAIALLVGLGLIPTRGLSSDARPVETRRASDQGDRGFEPISLAGFRSSAHHWRDLRDESRFVQAAPHQPAYRPDQVREIAANILLFQRANGGWPKDYDMAAILTADQEAAVRATRSKADTSYDNGNLHSQVDYLARAYAQSPEPEWRRACERGFDFLLASQYPEGGFPQRFPEPKGYHAHITFNDGVMIGILNVLDAAARGEPHFAWLDPERRARARESVSRGLACILKCQIRVDGTRTGWCQQHDATTFEPRPARTFELASICPQETTEIARFLIRRERPSAEEVASVEAAVAWLDHVQLTGIRTARVKAPVEQFPRHRADFDTVVLADPSARPLWARHYEIGTNRPVFAGRDGVRKYALSEIERERRTGTPWYGYWPASLIAEDYPEWRRRVGGR